VKVCSFTLLLVWYIQNETDNETKWKARMAFCGTSACDGCCEESGDRVCCHDLVGTEFFVTDPIKIMLLNAEADHAKFR